MDLTVLFDMDGVLATFGQIDTMEELYEKGYFENRPLMENMAKAVKLFVARNENRARVRILSCYLADSNYAYSEKVHWLQKHLPFLVDSAILIPCGMSKADALPLASGMVLVDDYSKNLHEWPGLAIKCRNGINGNNGTWEGKPSIDAYSKPEKICHELESLIFSD